MMMVSRDNFKTNINRENKKTILDALREIVINDEELFYEYRE